MATVWEREINALLEEGENFLKRAHAIESGDNSEHMNLNEIRAWSLDIEEVGKKLGIALPSSENSLNLVVGWETPAVTYVKRVLRRLGRNPGQVPVKQTPESSHASVSNSSLPRYDVALSFAGEDRPKAEELAEILRKKDISVFYDKYEKASLWGKNLYEHLAWVYKDAARYCVMFLSEHYKRKLWTTHERRNAQARAFREQSEYILPIRLDDTEIPGITETTGYIDFRKSSCQEIAELIIEKLENGEQ
jgi:hypothetical protein